MPGKHSKDHADEPISVERPSLADSLPEGQPDVMTHQEGFAAAVDTLSEFDIAAYESTKYGELLSKFPKDSRQYKRIAELLQAHMRKWHDQEPAYSIDDNDELVPSDLSQLSRFGQLRQGVFQQLNAIELAAEDAGKSFFIAGVTPHVEKVCESSTKEYTRLQKEEAADFETLRKTLLQDDLFKDDKAFAEELAGIHDRTQLEELRKKELENIESQWKEFQQWYSQQLGYKKAREFWELNHDQTAWDKAFTTKDVIDETTGELLSRTRKRKFSLWNILTGRIFSRKTMTITVVGGDDKNIMVTMVPRHRIAFKFRAHDFFGLGSKQLSNDDVKMLIAFMLEHNWKEVTSLGDFEPAIRADIILACLANGILVDPNVLHPEEQASSMLIGGRSLYRRVTEAWAAAKGLENQLDENLKELGLPNEGDSSEKRAPLKQEDLNPKLLPHDYEEMIVDGAESTPPPVTASGP